MPAPAGSPRPEKAAAMAERKDDESPFLERWSRRKLVPEEGEAQFGPEMDGPAAANGDGGGDDDEARRLELQKNREAAEAIDLESLDADSDYAPFFRAGVPKALKSAALRLLWRSSPVFANLDGLNDYDENFADPALVKKFANSAWQVGKGYFRDDAAETDGGGPVPDEIAEGAAQTGDPAAGEKAAATGEDAEHDLPDEQVAKPEEPDDADAPVIAADPDDMPQRVSLRNRLSLDDWDV